MTKRAFKARKGLENTPVRLEVIQKILFKTDPVSVLKNEHALLDLFYKAKRREWYKATNDVEEDALLLCVSYYS